MFSWSIITCFSQNQSFHILSVLAWVSSRCSNLLPQTMNMQFKVNWGCNRVWMVVCQSWDGLVACPWCLTKCERKLKSFTTIIIRCWGAKQLKIRENKMKVLHMQSFYLSLFDLNLNSCWFSPLLIIWILLLNVFFLPHVLYTTHTISIDSESSNEIHPGAPV